MKLHKLLMFLGVSGLLLTACAETTTVTEGDDIEEVTENDEAEETDEVTEEVAEVAEVEQGDSAEEIESVEAEPEDVEESETREDEIRNIIMDRTEEHNNYDGFEIESIRVNENAGDEENDTFIVLVDAIWTRRNREDTSNEFIQMLSQDIAATLHDQGADDVAEIAVFTQDEYNGNQHKHSFEWSEDGFAVTEQVIN